MVSVPADEVVAPADAVDVLTLGTGVCSLALFEAFPVEVVVVVHGAGVYTIDCGLAGASCQAVVLVGNIKGLLPGGVAGGA